MKTKWPNKNQEADMKKKRKWNSNMPERETE